MQKTSQRNPVGYLAPLDHARDRRDIESTDFPDAFAELGLAVAVDAREKQGDRAKMESILNAFRTKLEADLRAEGPDKGPSYHPLQIANLALVHCYLGQMEEALRESQQAIELVPKTKDVMKWAPDAFVRAEILVRAGQTDRAIDLLKEVTKVPYGPSYGELLGLQWDRVRGDARFTQIVEQLQKKL